MKSKGALLYNRSLANNSDYGAYRDTVSITSKKREGTYYYAALFM